MKKRFDEESIRFMDELIQRYRLNGKLDLDSKQIEKVKTLWALWENDIILLEALIIFENKYEVYFEDNELVRSLYNTIEDVISTVAHKIKAKEEFLWAESLPV